MGTGVAPCHTAQVRWALGRREQGSPILHYPFYPAVLSELERYTGYRGELWKTLKITVFQLSSLP